MADKGGDGGDLASDANVSSDASSPLNNHEKSSINGGTTDGGGGSSNSNSNNNTNNSDSSGQNGDGSANSQNSSNNTNSSSNGHTGAYNQVSGTFGADASDEKKDDSSNNSSNNNASGGGGGSKMPSRFRNKRGPSSAALTANEDFEQRQIDKMNAVTQAVASTLYDTKDENDANSNANGSNDTADAKNSNNNSKDAAASGGAAAANSSGGNDAKSDGKDGDKNNNSNSNNSNNNGANASPANGAATVPISQHPDIDRVISKLMTMTMRRSRKSKYITATQTDPKNMLTEKELENVCQQARKIFMSQPMLIEIDAPIKIVGDIHGQYFDLLRLFELGGMPPDANYVFLGDYVDRGRNSLEVISLLLSFKIKYPLNFFLLRGNHECASINRIYGFFDECKRRYKSGVQLWKKFCDVFNCLPVAAVIDDKIFCMHGGLSPDLRNFDQIRKIRRPTDVPDSGLLCDLLWADPDKEQIGWGENDRGVSYTFGPDILAKFLRKHDMDLVCRAHQVVEDGYEFFGSRRLVTIFSAPNYCGEFDNAGAMMSVDDTLMCSFHILKPTFGQKGTRFYS